MSNITEYSEKQAKLTASLFCQLACVLYFFSIRHYQ